MRVALTTSYGPPDVLRISSAPEPTIGDHEVLIRIRASVVTAGDRRLRAADFPGFTALFGRLLIGLTKPRHAVQGTMFAGRVVAVGRAVTRFAVGDDVFGGADHGAYAELLAMPADGPLAHMPSNLDYEQAAAIPYGAGTALHFLRDLAALQPGEKVLVLGASGGVGRYAIQIAKHMGAEVTAVCSRCAFELVRRLGADHVLDHHSQDFTQNGQRYDIIFDIADASSFSHSRSSLTPAGRYLTLYVSLGVLLASAWTKLTGGRRAMFDVALGEQQRTESLRELTERGVLQPVIAERFPLDRLADAHSRADEGIHGEIMVTISPDAPAGAPAPAPRMLTSAA